MKIEPFELKGLKIVDSFMTTSDEGDILHLEFENGSKVEIGARLMEDEITGNTFCCYELYIQKIY